MAAENPKPFYYEPLQDPSHEIRLLRLVNSGEHNCTGHTPRIDCELSTWRLDESPKYTAISYTWGDPLDTASIFVDGKTFVVRENCRYVLEQAMMRHASEHLWIDAICIDQYSNTEKSDQVAMMGEIYRKAERVDVCVGPDADRSTFYLQLAQQHSSHTGEVLRQSHQSGRLRNILEKMEKRGQVNAGIADHESLIAMDLFPRSLRPHVLSELGTMIFFDKIPRGDLQPLADAAHEFSGRTYFSRLWIIQELLLSRKAKVRCGFSSIDFQSIQDFESDLLAYLRDQRYAVRLQLDAKYSDLTSIWSSWEMSGMNLHELVDQFAEFKCSDIRDRIFGVLALVNWDGQDPIVLDYSESILSLALRCITSFAGLEIDDIDNDSDDINSRPKPQLWSMLSATRIAVALDLGHEHPEIAPLLQNRRSPWQDQSSPPVHTTPSYAAKRIVIPADGFCQLFEINSAKDLAACLALEKRPFSSGRMIAPTGNNYEKEPKLSQAPLRMVSNKNNEGLVRAIATAKAGDFLVAFSSLGFDLGLVVRKAEDSEGKYWIVGQALFDEDAYICPGGSSCVCSFDQEMHTAEDVTLEFCFDPEDLLLFCCQSLANDLGGEGLTEMQDLQYLRLQTSVVKKDDNYSSFAQLKEIKTQKEVESQKDGVPHSTLVELMEHFNNRPRLDLSTIQMHTDRTDKMPPAARAGNRDA